MADKIPQANLDPRASEWVRWVNSKLGDSLRKIEQGENSRVNISNAANSAFDAALGARNKATDVEQIVTRIPRAPIGLYATTNSYWDTDGNPVASVSLGWDEVLLGVDGDSIDVAGYEVWMGGAYFSSTEDPFAVIPAIAPGTPVILTVRTRTATSVYGAFSEPLTITTASGFAPIPAPSAPVLSSELGTISVVWDGRLSNGNAVPKQFQYAQAYTSSTQNGTYTLTGQALQGAGTIVIADAPVGSTRWVKLALVDRLGQVSTQSTAASIVVTGVDLTRIDEALADMGTDLSDLNGKVDNAIYTSLDEYVVTTSQTTPPPANAPWSSDTPDWEPGEYVWRRTKNTHIDGAVTYSSPAMLTGNDGTDAVLLRIASSRGTSFKNNAISTVLTVTVFKGAQQITNITQLRAEFGTGAFLEWYWRRLDDSSFGVISSADSRLSQAGFALTVSPADVDSQTVFQCILQQ